MKRLSLFAFVVLAGPLCANLCAGDIAILPATVRLNGPRDTQQVMLVEQDARGVTAELTGAAKFRSENEAVATVDETGFVRPVGDGQTRIIATWQDRTTSIPVTVAKFRDATPPSFLNDVQPIMTRFACNSGACHGALAGKGGFKLSLRGYDNDADYFAMTRQATARRIDRTDPAQSLLLLKGTRTLPHGGGTRIGKTSWMADVLREWVAGGAPGPADAESSIVKLEVFPKHATLKPKETTRMLVWAHYSDGRTRDVTRLAKFTSSESQVADTDESALIKVAGHGEAAISAMFNNRVATMIVSSPYPNTVAADAYAKSPVANVIDRRILDKLKELRLPPSPQATDGEFLRRAYLDSAGILPTPAEVDAFLNDPAPDKRAKLIDRLLERPEYVDYWAYKWCDVMLVSTRKLPQPAMWAFYRTIRKSIADNAPWDRFSREILTSTGSTLHNGGGNFFVLHKDVAELTESVAVTFLGMSITCARCHNHPLEKWTQDQYWQMANLFSRVGMKNGDRAGDVILSPEIVGDVLHPRRNVAVSPTPLDGKPVALESPADRRVHFAEWLTAPENPYFAKALVNRVWKNFFGRGLVEAEDDLRETNPATNPELLDTLAAEFVRNTYDVKALIRLIMNSSAYQRSSKPVAGNESDDRFYSRYLLRRLSGEVILDALSHVTGTPTEFNLIYTGVEGGTAATGNYPPGTRALQLPDSRVASRFLDAFGRADRQQTCSCERTSDSTVGQALMLNNGQVLNDKLRAPKSRVQAWLAEGVDNPALVRRIFAWALGRTPTEAELKKLTTLMGEYPATPEGRQQAVEDVVWAVVTGREFLFNH
jgi:Protein of unknown function (DUF1553)/Protein of unknown function (DUF1549)